MKKEKNIHFSTFIHYISPDESIDERILSIFQIVCYIKEDASLDDKAIFMNFG